MGSRLSKRLVVDASVAHAAGGETAVFPLSKQCRDVLKTMLKVGHRAVLTRAVREEWKKHESIFARQWRTAMMNRSKLILDDVAQDRELREAIEDAARTDKGRRVMLKDAHLIEAARATDGTILSLDDVVRALFGAASSAVLPLRAIVWVNPRHEEEGCVAWLKGGARSDRHRRLGRL